MHEDLDLEKMYTNTVTWLRLGRERLCTTVQVYFFHLRYSTGLIKQPAVEKQQIHPGKRRIHGPSEQRAELRHPRLATVFWHEIDVWPRKCLESGGK
jgi:hypothetical protein